MNLNIKVTKRDGRIVDFDDTKIKEAIHKAEIEVNPNWKDDNMAVAFAETVAEVVTNKIAKLNISEINIEQIQDMVEAELMSADKAVAKAYIIYRNDRNRIREQNSNIIKKVQKRVYATDVENSNANVDERSFSGREKEAMTEVGKALALEYDGLSKEVAEAHINMLNYQHDLEKAVYGIHNCLNLNFGEIFTYGFKTRNGDVRPPSSFSTACQLVAVAFQCQSQVQFGGVGTIHLDYDLAPFVKMSFAKHFKNGLKWLENAEDNYINNIPKKIDIDNPEAKSWNKAYKYALEMLENEGRQAAQGLYHNLNTLESRQGSQVPFTSINLGRDTSPEGRLVTKWIMEASIDGIGEHHLTSIFPISIFQYKNGINAKMGEPNYDLKQLALKSMSMRIYPNWVNGNWSQFHEDENNPDTFGSTINTVA